MSLLPAALAALLVVGPCFGEDGERRAESAATPTVSTGQTVSTGSGVTAGTGVAAGTGVTTGTGSGVAAGTGTAQVLFAHLTGFSWFDNTPPGSAAVSHPQIHEEAGGTGTFDDPVTVAVGHDLSTGADVLDWAPGTRFYVPLLRKYLIVEDTCGDGPTPQDGPCHRGLPAQAQTWLDVWVDGRAAGEATADECMAALTGVTPVVLDPQPGHAVQAGPVVGADGCTLWEAPDDAARAGGSAAPAQAAPAPAATAPGVSAGTVGTAGTAGTGTEAARVVALTNAARADAGCGPLTETAALDAYAARWAATMAGGAGLEHSDLGDGVSAENIARGQDTADEVVADWLSSPGHRRNILNCSYTGIGVAKVGEYWSQNFGRG